MPRSLTGGPWSLLPVACAASLCLIGCDSGDRPSPDHVVVTSPIDTIIPAGFSIQLTAVALTRSDETVQTTFAWSSSNSAVASVSGTGLVHANAAGRTEITARQEGTGLVDVGTVGGILPIRVLDADIVGLQGLIRDPLIARFTSALSEGGQSAIATALDDYDSGLGSGNLVLVIGGLRAIAAAADSATDPTDRVLLATMTLFTDIGWQKLNY